MTVEANNIIPDAGIVLCTAAAALKADLYVSNQRNSKDANHVIEHVDHRTGILINRCAL